jgi:hypothetical protein
MSVLKKQLYGLTWDIHSPCLFTVAASHDLNVHIEMIKPRTARLAIGFSYFKHFYSMDEAARWFGAYVTNRDYETMLREMFAIPTKEITSG